MKEFTNDIKNGIGAALNEADLLGLEYDPGKRTAAATLRILTMDKEGNIPEDRRIQVLFQPVGRILATYRTLGEGNKFKQVQKIRPGDLLGIVEDCGRLPVHGWELIDMRTSLEEIYGEDPSFDIADGPDGLSHWIDLFQDNPEKELAVRIYFDSIRINRPDYAEVPLEGFIEGGKKWWDEFYKGNPKTLGFGIVPGMSACSTVPKTEGTGYQG